MHAPDAHRVLTDQLATLSADDERGRLVRVALARIEAGEWGSCAACGAPIDQDRLTRLPTATHCADCDVVLTDSISSGEWPERPLPAPAARAHA